MLRWRRLKMKSKTSIRNLNKFVLCKLQKLYGLSNFFPYRLCTNYYLYRIFEGKSYTGISCNRCSLSSWIISKYQQFLISVILVSSELWFYSGQKQLPLLLIYDRWKQFNWIYVCFQSKQSLPLGLTFPTGLATLMHV